MAMDLFIETQLSISQISLLYRMNIFKKDDANNNNDSLWTYIMQLSIYKTSNEHDSAENWTIP